MNRFRLAACLTVIVSGLYPAPPAASAADDVRLDLAAASVSAVGGELLDGVPAEGAVRIAFRREVEDRCFVGLDIPLGRVGFTPQSYAAQYSLHIDGEGEARPAIVVWTGGGVWYRVSARPLEPGVSADVGMPLAAMLSAAFSSSRAGAPDWALVSRIRVGAVVDGACEGVLTVARARISAEPYRASAPQDVPLPDASGWDLGKDPAADARVSRLAEGPEGEDCYRLDFTFPGGRHIYAVPVMRLPPSDLGAFSSLELTYKAELPEGLAGLLLTLNEEGGAVYCADPAPPAAAEWRTLSVPFADLRLGSWTGDANGRFDPEQVTRMSIGVHGTAVGAGGGGVVRVARIRFLP